MKTFKLICLLALALAVLIWATGGAVQAAPIFRMPPGREKIKQIKRERNA